MLAPYGSVRCVQHVYGFEGMNEGKKECMISRDDNEERIITRNNNVAFPRSTKHINEHTLVFSFVFSMSLDSLSRNKKPSLAASK